MATSDDSELRGFVKGVVRAEAHEVAAQSDVPDPLADQRLAEAMVAKYAPRRRPWQKVGVRAAGLGAAAALGVMLLLKPWTPSMPAPLDYRLTVRTDDGMMGSSSSGQKLSRDGALNIELRPGHAVSEKVQVQGFVHRAGAYQPWAAELACSKQGTCQLSRPVHELPVLPALPVGPLELVFVLSRKPLPPREELMRELTRGTPRPCADCLVLRSAVELVGP